MISQGGTNDEVSVTFWGTEFFESEEGEQVRYGSSVSVTILRQVEPEKANEICDVTEIAMMAVSGLVLVAFLLLTLIGGSCLPIWIFLTSLSLVVHTILFSVELP